MGTLSMESRMEGVTMIIKNFDRTTCKAANMAKRTSFFVDRDFIVRRLSVRKKRAGCKEGNTLLQ